MKAALSLALCFLIAVAPFLGAAQEGRVLQTYGKRYLDYNIHNLDKYSQRIDRQQSRLLARLERKERKLYHQLSRKDSAACQRITSQPLSYDSISRLLHPDSAALASRNTHRAQPTIDSLRRIAGFLGSKAGTVSSQPASVTGYSDKLGVLQSKLSYQQYIQGLIDQRSNGLKNFSAKVPALAGIEKQVFYAKSRIKAYKQMADDPSAAEEKALEYLQGEKGFDQALNKPEAGSMQTATSADELEKMGFQTKRQLNAQLQQQFGSNLGGLQEKMGSQVSDWQSKNEGISEKVKGVGDEVKEAKTNLAQTKQSLRQLKNTKKPSFKVNPMRGLPFSQRIEKQYGFQTTRATTDGRPAMLELSAMAGFKHTSSLSYGLGIGGSFGLGQNWSNIKFSFEGIGLKSYAAWKWRYGIGAYVGYERIYKIQRSLTPSEIANPQSSIDNTSRYSESVLIGLTKSYKVNSKWNGQVQVLYDVWWKEKGSRGPILVRFSTLN